MKIRHENTPIWEWIIAGVGLALVLIALGTTLYRAVMEESTPPILNISVESIVPATNGYLVTFTVANTGNQTAAGLSIEGNLMKSGESVETSPTTLTYAPANSTRRGGLFFTKDPRAFELQIHALGYEKP